MQPTATINCSAQRGCNQSDVFDKSIGMLYDKGKCSALLTRDGFFDFFVFRTQCDVAHNVSVVCQHDQKAKVLLHNNMSDIKVSTVGRFNILQVFSSCDVGWFLVDNVCVNIYNCAFCSRDTIADEECIEHGGHLAYHVLNNVTISSPKYILYKNTELSLFWGMFHHMDDISPSPKETFKSYLNVINSNLETNIAVNGSGLCVAFNMSTHCNTSNIVLSIKNDFISLGKIVYKTVRKEFDYLVRISNANYYLPPWSVIHQPNFQIGGILYFTLCEKPRVHTLMFTHCSDVFMSCNDGTCVHDSLVCDGQPHCLHGEDEADCEHICSDHTHSCMSHCHHKDLCSCSPGYFQCVSGGCVPLQKLCDKIAHCVDASDEPPTCVYLRPTPISHHILMLGINIYINKLIQQNMIIREGCVHSSKEALTPLHNVEYKMHFHQHRCSRSNFPSSIKFFCTIIGTPHITTQHYFSLDRLCIYDHDCDDDYLYHCHNGFHLLKCKDMYCVGRFKCPSSYCISFDHICNKVCDCPHCEDERICSKLLCPGMVLIEQIGSGLRCSTKVAALKHTMNMRQVIHRRGINITDDFPVYIHLEDVMDLAHFILAPEVVVYCKILHSRFAVTDLSILYRMVSIRRLLFKHNNIQKVYDFMFTSMSQLILLDLSYNFIKYLPKMALCSLHNLQYIFLHHNLIAELQIGLFVSNPKLKLLMLESNNLNPQSELIDGSFPSMYRLSSDIPRLCCAFERVELCSPPFPLRVSCSNLITSKTLIIFGWIIGLSTLLLTFCCLILLLYKLCNPVNQIPKAVMLFSVNLILTELVSSLCLLSSSVINELFHDIFGVVADQWRHSWKCLGLESLFSVSSRSTLAFTAWLSVHFAIHIPSVIRINSSQNTTFVQIIISWLIILPMCIAPQILEHIRNVDPFNYFCFPFTTLFPLDPLILSFQIAMLIFDSLLLIIIIVSYGYLLAFIMRRRKNKALKSMSKRNRALQNLGVRLTVLILSNVFTWMPVLCLQILVLLKIAVLPDIYFWCVLVSVSINLIIDPILLIRNMLA